MALLNQLRDWLRARIPETYREMGFRIVSAVSILLLGMGAIDQDHAFLWTQVGVGTVTCLFAWLYTDSNQRAALYALVGPIGGLLMSYGLLNNAQWAVVLAATGQVFGVTTAAAKVVQAPSDATPQDA